MCEFCETIGNHMLKESKYIYLYTHIEKDDLPCIVAVETDDVRYYPKFCPECGRKLY